MRKSRVRSFAFRFCSLLTVLSATAVSNGAKNVEESRHSLIISDDTHRFTESLVIVSTLDGKLRGLDPVRNGMIQWSAAFSDEPLLSSSLSSVQMMKEFIGFRLIPSLDGGLYQFSWDSIEAMPLNADTLLSSSFKLNDGIGLIGAKNVQQMGIDPGTGKQIYSCSDDGCDSGGSDSLRDILIIKRTQKTVRAVNERTGAERWNFSVGQHKLSLLSTHSDGKHDRLPDEDLNVKQSIQVSIPEGIVAVVHSSGSEIFSKKILWKQQFDTPVAAVWVLHNGVLEEVDLLKATVPPKSLNGDNDMPLMYYIGSHEDQLYIHPSDKMEDAVRIAIEKIMSGSTSKDQAVADLSKRRIIWKPYLATSASRTPAIVGKTELAVRQPLDYPFDNGHYFYGPMPISDGDECLNNNTNSDGNGDNGQGFSMKLKKYISKWWSEWLILLFTTGVFARQIFKYWRKHSAIKKSSLTLNLPCGDLEVEVRRKSDDNKPVQSPISVQSPDNFQSRYQVDFEHETCLGSGAYGLVFQARNKLDDCQYAVKRIRLPNNQKARTKVMREVKVLATLEHPGIVRYFHSWCEEPPVEWLREWDDKLRGDSKCPTINTMPSYTSSSLDEDMQLQEVSLYDKLSDYERSVDVSVTGGSRKRHDTITVENDDMASELEQTSGHYEEVDSDNSSSFDVEFEPGRTDHSVANNNGKKVNVDSSGVVTRTSSASQDDNSNSSSSEIEQSNMETQSSEKRRFPFHLLYIQMQLCRKDSLKDWLNANTVGRNLSHSIDIFRQLVVAVDYIHQKGHIHRDLKPSNILFALDGKVKVGDFGLVAACQPSLGEDDELDESIHSSNQNLTGQVGTQLYASPEQEAGTNYCFRTDVFSLGIIFFELFHVFHTQMERLKILTAVRKRNIPEAFSEDMPLQSELALWLLAKNPSDRPSAQAISKSRVFSELLDKLTRSQSATTTATTESDNR